MKVEETGGGESPVEEPPVERFIRNKDLDLLVEEDLINGKDYLRLIKRKAVFR